jgi:peptidoglycan hydrolase-like protein with peptidoglycan-binding domain
LLIVDGSAVHPANCGENIRISRDFFKRPSGGKQGVGGSIISDIQASLNAISAFNIDVDGVFGSQTEQALSGFQSAQGLPVSGTVSDTTWPVLQRTANL